MCLQYKSFENTVGKVFYLFEGLLPLSSNLKLSSANSFSLEESKMLLFGNGLMFTILSKHKFYKTLDCLEFHVKD